MPTEVPPSLYRPRSLGLQCSLSDLAVLAVAALAMGWLWDSMRDIAWFVGFVVGHFFLFCNVFRIHRKFELIWAAVFVASVIVGLYSGLWSLVHAMLWQLPLTALFVMAEMRTDRYHGVGCARINAAQVARWNAEMAKEKA